MKNIFIKAIGKLLIILCLTNSYVIADNAPAVDFENILNSNFYETGLIGFGDYRIAFAPEPPFNGYVAVVNDEGKVVAKTLFYEDYIVKNGVFAVIRAQDGFVDLAGSPGIYMLVFVINDVAATRFPVELEQISSEDAFNPETKYHFEGFWRTMAHITMRTMNGKPVPELTLWTGGKDFADGTARREGYVATLLRNGNVVAHSKKNYSDIMQPGPYKENAVTFFHPHTEREEPNALPFTLDDWQVDGEYEISIVRTADDKQIRSFDFDVVDGKIRGIERSQLGYEPAVDFVMPRVLKSGTTTFEMIEAIWLEDHR